MSLENLAPLAMLGGALLVVIAINLLIVFLVNPKDFPRKEVFGTVWPLTKMHLWLLIGAVVFQQLFVQIPTVLVGLGQVALNIPNDDPVSGLLNAVLSFVLGIIVQSGFIALALHVIDGGGKARFSDLFSQLSIFWRYAGASILYGLLIVVGFFLLIVPGIYWMLTYSFWPYFLVDKKVSILDSLKMSARATKGHKRSLFALYALITALNVIGLCVFFVGLLVTVPMSVLALAYAYRKLTATSSTSVSAAVPLPNTV